MNLADIHKPPILTLLLLSASWCAASTRIILSPCVYVQAAVSWGDSPAPPGLKTQDQSETTVDEWNHLIHICFFFFFLLNDFFEAFLEEKKKEKNQADAIEMLLNQV